MNEKQLIKRFYEDVITNNRAECIQDYIAEESVVRIGESVYPLGVAGIREHLAATKATYPDYTMRILRQYQDGDMVISEFLMTGTHKGEFVGITPTGKTITISGVDMDRVVDGKIVEHGGAANTFDAFLEHGLIAPV